MAARKGDLLSAFIYRQHTSGENAFIVSAKI
jgi:hypothetical protein